MMKLECASISYAHMNAMAFITCLILLVAPIAYSDEEDGLTTFDDEIVFDDIFRRSTIRFASVSPTGEFVAYFRDNTLVIGNPENGYHDIREFANTVSIADLDWIGLDTVWIDVRRNDSSRRGYYAIRVGKRDGGGYGSAREITHYESGFVQDRLLDDRDHVIFARIRVEGENVATDLYRVNVFEPMGKELKRRNRVDTGSDKFFYYVRNVAGEYVLGVRFAEGVPEIWRRLADGEDWQHIWTGDGESRFEPWQLSADGETLWVLTNSFTDRLAAVEFDLDKREFGAVLYEHYRADLDAILMSKNDGRPVGVVYTEQGLYRYHYFANDKRSEFDALRAHFPGSGIVVTGYSEDQSVRLVFASSTTSRGAYFVCDIVIDTCDLLESVAPWLDDEILHETIAMDIPSSDGLVVEVFLTLPTVKNTSVPLITMPHGGPIGVSDDRYFSPEVQWLAHNGYAVLQVNYRGSSGYGQHFQAAGLRQWGRGIEDDIEASVMAVVENYPQIDKERIGVFGGSYGGYSALMSVIRNPELFKCAASWAGVTDLTLLFNQTTLARTKYLREAITRYIGDPDVDYAEQIRNSPVYRYKEIRRPVLLGHGLGDSVVDIEHSWRLRKMMRLTDYQPEWVLVESAGHGFGYISEARKFYTPLIAFLDKHLKAETAEVPEAVQTNAVEKD